MANPLLTLTVRPKYEALPGARFCFDLLATLSTEAAEPVRLPYYTGLAQNFWVRTADGEKVSSAASATACCMRACCKQKVSAGRSPPLLERCSVLTLNQCSQ